MLIASSTVAGDRLRSRVGPSLAGADGSTAARRSPRLLDRCRARACLTMRAFSVRWCGKEVSPN